MLRQKSSIELPPGIKACPACGMLIEKIDGDHQVMCGCEARPAGGTYQKAIAGGGCGHEFNFATLAPLGCARAEATMETRATSAVAATKHRFHATPSVSWPPA